MISLINKLLKTKTLNECLIRNKFSNVNKVFDSNKSSVDSNKIKETDERVERNFTELSVESFSQLLIDFEIKSKVEKILSEYEFEKYGSLRVPSTLTVDNMKDLLELRNETERKSLIKHLFLKEFRKLKSKRKREQKSEKYWSVKSEIYANKDCGRTGIWDHNRELVYGLWHNSLFSKISKTANNRLHTNRLRNACIFGQKLIVDLDYEQYMSLIESRLLAKQIHLLYNYNKFNAIEPFDLHFTNCDFNSNTMKEIQKLLIQWNSHSFIAPFHSNSFVKHFPKNKLVYLSPHSKQTLNFSHEDIYIVGGIVDKTCREPVSLVKAESKGIRTARLPLEEHILWNSGTKHLCLNHIIAILHDMKISNNWRKSLTDNIPQRKQKQSQQIEYEDELRRNKFRKSIKSLKL